MLSIQTNVNSMNAQENLRMTTDFQARTISRLTSGYRINQSGDDAAGLAIANKFRSDVAELTQGVRNANDGLSTLQIIDGGLSNVSKMLDRLKTLATQSASSTFTGNRGTLNSEYQSLLTEIDRQAANIGLGSGDSNAGRNNANIAVYLGGGSATGNSQVSVDLAGASNLVNSTGLGLTGSQIIGNTVAVDLDTANISSGTFLASGSSQQFRFSTTNGTVNVNVQGNSSGLSATEVVTQLNQGLSGTGLTVSIGASNGRLQISGSGSYAVAIDAVVGSGAVAATVNDASAKTNAGKYSFGGAVTAIGAANQTLTFTPAGGSAIAVALNTGDSIDVVFNKLRANLATSGIDVVRSGNEVKFQSDSNFTLARNTSASSTGGIGTLADAGGSGQSATIVAKSNTSDPTSDALVALTRISSAVTNLGNVQGKIGTGQNRLQYAIQLAQSQITNFSAAESRIRDADVAQEAANLTKAQVLSQASMAALAQANSAPQSVLSLLRG